MLYKVDHAPSSISARSARFADLDEQTAVLGQQIAGDRKAFAQVREVRVHAKLPRVAERADLFRLGAFSSSATKSRNSSVGMLTRVSFVWRMEVISVGGFGVLAMVFC